MIDLEDYVTYDYYNLIYILLILRFVGSQVMRQLIINFFTSFLNLATDLRLYPKRIARAIARAIARVLTLVILI